MEMASPFQEAQQRGRRLIGPPKGSLPEDSIRCCSPQAMSRHRLRTAPCLKSSGKLCTHQTNVVGVLGGCDSSTIIYLLLIMQLTLNPYLIFLLHVTISGLLTYWVLWKRFSLDAANDRSSHTGSTPSAGGVGIVVSIIIGLIYLMPDYWPLIIGLVIIAGVSVVDDIRSSSKRLRLSFQFAAALLIVSVAVPLVDKSTAVWLLTLVAVVWMVGLSNAFNFMDGLDGFAGSTALIASAFLAIIGNILQFDSAFWLGTVMAASNIGFLIFNWPPAKIFMGDVGSASLGFIFAAAAVLFVPTMPWWVIPLLLMHFIVDTSFTMIRRLLGGENITQAHRSHIYQLLNRSGWSHTQLSLLTIMLSILQGAAAVISLLLEQTQQIVVLVSFVFVYLITALFVFNDAKRRGLLD